MAQVRTEIDWTACELIEQIPGKVSGRPIVRGTRILPDAIVDSYDLGESIDELPEGFPALSVAQIRRLIEFAHVQRGAVTVKERRYCTSIAQIRPSSPTTRGKASPQAKPPGGRIQIDHSRKTNTLNTSSSHCWHLPCGTTSPTEPGYDADNAISPSTIV
jgi:uncharacterized protein (DUF433 family)